ncbi:hypothetical protein FA95DRAFT_371057 [Auriscalpium vulgare]|uniref:Uncharacterized protein n=1 Tax=Auriscalpium vulgare TaxID=40419 RepID=A0ACB8RJ47_9AGAM|nr:hypothetical protein FA95DRAFT_371057 [Auriscalpium vulgare]
MAPFQEPLGGHAGRSISPACRQLKCPWSHRWPAIANRRLGRQEVVPEACVWAELRGRGTQCGFGERRAHGEGWCGERGGCVYEGEAGRTGVRVDPCGAVLEREDGKSSATYQAGVCERMGLGARARFPPAGASVGREHLTHGSRARRALRYHACCGRRASRREVEGGWRGPVSRAGSCLLPCCRPALLAEWKVPGYQQTVPSGARPISDAATHGANTTPLCLQLLSGAKQRVVPSASARSPLVRPPHTKMAPLLGARSQLGGQAAILARASTAHGPAR